VDQITGGTSNLKSFVQKLNILALKMIWCCLVCLICPIKYQFMWMSAENVGLVNVKTLIFY